MSPEGKAHGAGKAWAPVVTCMDKALLKAAACGRCKYKIVRIKSPPKLSIGPCAEMVPQGAGQGGAGMRGAPGPGQHWGGSHPDLDTVHNEGRLFPVFPSYFSLNPYQTRALVLARSPHINLC